MALFKVIHNSPQLREWLRRNVKTVELCKLSEFHFNEELFAKALAQITGLHPRMSQSHMEIRAAHLLLTAGHPGREPSEELRAKIRTRMSDRHFWKVLWAVAVIGLLLFLAAKGHAQQGNRTSGVVIQLQNQGANLGAPVGGGLITLNASTNVTLARTGTTSRFTLTATGGAGSGCTPPGTTLNAILTDLTGGACGAATKWTASGTTLTGIATAILDMSAAARLRLPQVSAPTTEGDAAFNTTSHLPVWGFNGASTATIPTTLANVSHKWLNSYDQTTGAHTQTQPDYSDLTGVPSTFAPAGHNLLSSAHSDTTAAAAVRGDGLFAIGATPTWQRLAHPATSGGYFKWNGTDVVASSLAAAGTGNCTNQFVRNANADAAPTCNTVALATDVSGQLPIGNVGSAGLSATSPVAIASTGAITCTTCATTTNGGAITGTAPVAISAAGAVSITGAAGQVLAGASPAFTATPALGTDNSVAGTVQLANSGANAHTIFSSGATTTNTIAGFAAVPTTTDLITCVTASTTCTLTDSGIAVASNKIAIAAIGTAGLSGTSPVAISTAGAISCSTCTVTIANGTSALGTGAISSATCATVVTTSATGTATTDNIMADFNADPHAVTGYVPSTSGMLTIIKYPTANNVNFLVCNNSSGSITPGAITLNWRVVR